MVSVLEISHLATNERELSELRPNLVFVFAANVSHKRNMTINHEDILPRSR